MRHLRPVATLCCVVVKHTPGMGAGSRAHWLEVGPYWVWTTLTTEDLANPRWWTLRTPLQWAAYVVTIQTKKRPPELPERMTDATDAR